MNHPLVSDQQVIDAVEPAQSTLQPCAVVRMQLQ